MSYAVSPEEYFEEIKVNEKRNRVTFIYTITVKGKTRVVKKTYPLDYVMKSLLELLGIYR